MVIVLNKEGNWCLNFKALHKLTIKEKNFFVVIYDLLDDIHGAKLFTKLDFFRTL